MPDFFDQNPTRPGRALQVWIILVACAHNRQTLTYSDLAARIGYQDVRSLGQVLDYVWHYCDQHWLPPLTGLVVNKNTGLPGEGMGEYTLADQEKVFSYNWYNVIPPSLEEFQQAYQNGGGE
jgi:putative restriction endonuclease